MVRFKVDSKPPAKSTDQDMRTRSFPLSSHLDYDRKVMIREPAVAGLFYSADPAVLGKTIESFVIKSTSPLKAQAVLVPHAGYIYSGAVAGAVFSAVELPRRLVVLGPNHTGCGLPLALYPSGEWRTPLGLATIDAGMNRHLIEACPGLVEDSRAHQREHSLEVQIPFLQALIPSFEFSAICVGTANRSTLDELGRALSKAVRSSEEPVLLIASSDMTHFESVTVAAQQDKMAIDRMIAVDPEGLYRVVDENEISMCGFAPAVAVLTACRELGSSVGRLIRYSNSGEVSGDFDRVVAYAGLAFN
jgi:AmmeMemoRadiSam system protein B